jgi:hypothetical protein
MASPMRGATPAALAGAPRTGAGATAGDGTPTEPELSTFFKGVCRAVVDAQKELDTESLQYAIALRNTPVPPSFFSMPNVKAEVKMGFSEVTETGIKAIIFNDSTQIEKHGESTVSFEIAAAPPPPGSLDRFAQPTRFLFPGKELGTVFTAVEALRGCLTTEAQTILDATWKNRAVAMRLPDAPGLFEYLLMVPGAASRLLVLQLTDQSTHTNAFTKADDVAGSLAGVVTAIRAALDAAVR